MGTYSFHLGTFSCTVIYEGGGKTRFSSLVSAFSNVDLDDMKQACQAIGKNPEDTEEISHNILLIDTGKKKIAIDTGNGAIFGRETNNKFLKNLNSAGIQADDIDIIFITHLHRDHYGGLVDGNFAPIFPNARLLISKREWDFWQSEAGEKLLRHHQEMIKMPDYVEKSKTIFGVMQRTIECLNTDDEIVSGIRIFDIPGHTPWQAGVLLNSEDETLIHGVDVLHSAIQISNPDWQLTFDSDALQGANTRKAFIERCSQEQLLTFFYHVAFPGLGHIKQLGNILRWEAIKT